MPRGKNAQLAVDLFHDLRLRNNWSSADAWKGIAILLLSCKIYKSKWVPFHDVVVFRESNDFKILASGAPNETIVKAKRLTEFLESLLEIPPGSCCKHIGRYWANKDIAKLQPNNLVGHAFRSIVVEILRTYGDAGIRLEEEVDPTTLFPGVTFHQRSEGAKIDVVAFKNNVPVALISCRWRFRHDRVDVTNESVAYRAAAMQSGYPNCQFYAVIGEFAPSRLVKVLESTAGVAKNPSIAGTVHFKPELITDPKSLGENGRTTSLLGLDWLVQQTHQW